MKCPQIPFLGLITVNAMPWFGVIATDLPSIEPRRQRLAACEGEEKAMQRVMVKMMVNRVLFIRAS